MVTPVLFEKKTECCACGACLNICPKQAISLHEDEYGFLYPKINEELCIGCGACKKVCAFQNVEETNTPIKCFAAVSKDKEQAKKSASGGIFAALATKAIQEGGVVYGAAFDDDWTLSHRAVYSLSDLTKLQGSKYVQSNTGRTFTEVKNLLKDGKKVIYSGTPCQIAGLKGYLGKDFENLLTIDIVCHGVPSNRMFKDYKNLLEQKNGGKLTEFTFRDKALGWGINGSAVISGKKTKIWQSASSYLYYFAHASLYRENCYTCKYACSHRPADITIGDFWGIEKQHPEYLKKNVWDESKGISLAIANTEIGSMVLSNSKNSIEFKQSDFVKVSKGNAQLKHPSIPESRTCILEAYEKNGWKTVDDMFRKKIGIMKYSSQIKAFIPSAAKKTLKRWMK